MHRLTKKTALFIVIFLIAAVVFERNGAELSNREAEGTGLERRLVAYGNAGVEAAEFVDALRSELMQRRSSMAEMKINDALAAEAEAAAMTEVAKRVEKTADKPAVPEIDEGRITEPLSVIPEIAAGETVSPLPAAPEISAGETVSPLPAVPEMNTGKMTGSVSVQQETFPAAPLPEKDMIEEQVWQEESLPDVKTADSAFLIDSDGMLYGVAEEKLEIVDGYLELPAEGCIGIRKGAFTGIAAEIVELYIPASISRIEEGAFLGLGALEWIETESGNPGCTASEGVLYDSTQTVLLAFPGGRTGGYQVPAVNRIASMAFADTSLHILDLWYCGAVELGEMILGDNVADGLTVVLPQEGGDVYRQAFAGYNLTLR